MFVVGLTGDVGAGKSTLMKVWRALGAHIIDSDAVAKSQWQKTEIREKAAARWGADILEGAGVNFARIAEAAFTDEAEYRFMIGLIHPPTRVELTREACSLRGWIIAEIPLLFEAGRHDWIDCVVYVTAPSERRVARNKARGWDDGEIARRERFMLDSEKKRAMSDLVLCNDASLASWTETAERTGRLFQKMSAVRELTTQCASEEEAERIARALLNNRLAACVNIAETKSLYRWQGEIERASEWSLTCKTTMSAMRRAIGCIKSEHSYELPAISAREFCGGDAATLRWIVEACE